MNWHLDWTHVTSALALAVITWSLRKVIGLCQKGLQEIRNLASVNDVKNAIHEANEAQLEKIRKEGLLNGVYVRDDPDHKKMVQNVRQLVQAAGRHRERR